MCVGTYICMFLHPICICADFIYVPRYVLHSSPMRAYTLSWNLQTFETRCYEMMRVVETKKPCYVAAKRWSADSVLAVLRLLFKPIFLVINLSFFSTNFCTMATTVTATAIFRNLTKYLQSFAKLCKALQSFNEALVNIIAYFGETLWSEYNVFYYDRKRQEIKELYIDQTGSKASMNKNDKNLKTKPHVSAHTASARRHSVRI
jgi:hypothetical protein